VARTSAVCALALLASFVATPRASAQCGCMDVALVIDDSGSMGGAINNVRDELPTIISTAQSASGGDVRFALVTFPNVAGQTNDGVTVRVPFTTDTTLIETALQPLIATGGFGEPESSDAALEVAITGSTASSCTVSNGPVGSFRSGCVKIAVLITDAHPGGCDDTFTVGGDDRHAHNVAVAADKAGVVISAIYVPTFGIVKDDIVAIMEDYADTSNGAFVQTEADGTGTADGITDIIATCGGRAQVCTTRNARFWFTHAVPSETNCVSLLGAIQANGNNVRLGFVRLPVTYENADGELDAEDALIEALGLYYRSPSVTGEERGTQSARSAGSQLCRERKKLARELIAATANFRLLGTVPGNCSYVHNGSVTHFPAYLL